MRKQRSQKHGFKQAAKLFKVKITFLSKIISMQIHFSAFYITEVKWISEDILFTLWMARSQNIVVQTISQSGNNFQTKQVSEI